MNVVVVGGGIVGLSSAYYLSRRGVDVVVCERANVGSGSTERSAGGIRTQFSTPVNVELSLASIDVWEDFEEHFGVDIDYRRSGYLFLARERATDDAFVETVAMQNELGVPSRYLSPEDAAEYCPALRVDRFRGATYSPLDGFADPHLALQGFADRVREMGVDVRTGTPVTDVVLDDSGAVTGVQTPSGHLHAEYVVNAAGPWARRVAAMAGLDLPIAPKRRQIAIVDPERPIPESVPLTIDLDTGAYFRPERSGSALVGGHFDEDDPDADPDAYATKPALDWTATVLERSADVASYFGPKTRVKRGWAGLYAVTPDHHPIIEETIPGFVNAVGFSGHGFQHAPATGRLVSELVVDGHPSLLDVSSLGSQRFERGELHSERNVA